NIILTTVRAASGSPSAPTKNWDPLNVLMSGSANSPTLRSADTDATVDEPNQVPVLPLRVLYWYSASSNGTAVVVSTKNGKVFRTVAVARSSGKLGALGDGVTAAPVTTRSVLISESGNEMKSENGSKTTAGLPRFCSGSAGDKTGVWTRIRPSAARKSPSADAANGKLLSVRLFVEFVVIQ